MKSLILLFLFLTACTSTHEQNVNPVELIWNILERASIDGWTSEKLLDQIGKPTQIFKQPAKEIDLAWIYKNQASGFQEWGIGIKNNNVIDSITYIPNESYRNEFTIEKITTRWKNLDCKHQQKQELSPGLVKTIKYIECNHGTHVIKYNKYNEVESIFIKSNKY